jgi:hypothetical protein
MRILRNKFLISLGAVMIISMSIGCGGRKKTGVQIAPSLNLETKETEETMVMDRDWWMERAHQTLRPSAPENFRLKVDDGIQYLSKAGRRAYAKKLVEDDYFYNLVADFGLYWMGLRAPSVISNVSVYSSGVQSFRALDDSFFNYPIAAYAAQDLKKGKDFVESMFQEYSPVIISQVEEPYLSIKGVRLTPKDHILTLEERSYWRKRVLQEAERVAAETIRLVAAEGVESAALYCDNEKINAYMGTIYVGSTVLDRFGSTYLYGFGLGICDYYPDQETPEDYVDFIKMVLTGLRGQLDLYDEIDGQFPNQFNRKKVVVSEFRFAPSSFAGRDTRAPSWDTRFFRKLPNSSTNRNRKRASYVLNRYFCDDLTPLNIENPKSHGEGIPLTESAQHGKADACYSCHYKLDPMAGFFRERGADGYYANNSDQIFFDDAVVSLRSEYEAPWKSLSGQRMWDIGYIRSTTDESKNSYGETFSDMLKVLREAPEVRQCFVKRAFEYIVGEGQSYDQDWASELVKNYNETASKDAVQAMKNLFVDLVASEAFARSDLKRNQCYDAATGAEPSKVPCQIRSLLAANCVSCHSKTNLRGGLDLTTWQTYSRDAGGFEIVRSNGEKISGRNGLLAIMDRINSKDPNQKMPLMKSMPELERQTLFKWLEERSR